MYSEGVDGDAQTRMITSNVLTVSIIAHTCMIDIA
jgi:hypothetical protein